MNVMKGRRDIHQSSSVNFIHELTILTDFDNYLVRGQALLFTRLQCKSFENTVGKGEIAHYKQFLLFPRCFLTISRAFHHFHQI